MKTAGQNLFNCLLCDV